MGTSDTTFSDSGVGAKLQLRPNKPTLTMRPRESAYPEQEGTSGESTVTAQTPTGTSEVLESFSGVEDNLPRRDDEARDGDCPSLDCPAKTDRTKKAICQDHKCTVCKTPWYSFSSYTAEAYKKEASPSFCLKCKKMYDGKCLKKGHNSSRRRLIERFIRESIRCQQS